MGRTCTTTAFLRSTSRNVSWRRSFAIACTAASEPSRACGHSSSDCRRSTPSSTTSSTSAVSPEVVSQLAPSGKLRAAINYGNPALAIRNAATGELRGIAVDLSRELGRRLDVPVELVAYDTVAKLLAGLKAGEWEVAFLAVDPARTELAFSPAYMEVEVTYLVRESSGMRDVSQVDSPGVRIAVQSKNA